MLEVLLQVVVTLLGSAIGKHNNFCRPLEDYGPREDNMEERQVCQTTMVKDCKPVTESDCMDITELRCEVRFLHKRNYWKTDGF